MKTESKTEAVLTLMDQLAQCFNAAAIALRHDSVEGDILALRLARCTRELNNRLRQLTSTADNRP